MVEAIINETCEENFGTAYETYTQPIKQDSSIRLQGVKDYLSKRDGIQVKTEPKIIDSLFLLVLNMNLKLT